MPLLRRRRLARAARVARPRRRLRRLVTAGAAVAGIVAWRERQMTRNAEQYGPPPAP